MSKRETAKKMLRVTLRRSPIGRRESQKATVRSLGLTRMGQVIVRPDSPVLRGMLNKVSHLVLVEEVEG